MKDTHYQLVKHGESLPRIVDGGWFWVCRTYSDAFILGIEKPVSLIEGMQFMIALNSAEARYMVFLTKNDDPNLSLF